MGQIVNHATCVAAGMRDGLRTAQFYARDMTGADGSRSGKPHNPTALSKAVALAARKFDGGLSRAADISVRMLNPRWRNLPSPFDTAARNRVISDLISKPASFNSEFTAYFFRATRHILERWTEPPTLVLEHRIKSVRRDLVIDHADGTAPSSAVLAQVLVRLIRVRPIAKVGKAKSPFQFLDEIDANIPVMAAASLALLLAQEGRPRETVDEDDFLGISGVLLASKTRDIEKAVDSNDTAALAAILDSVILSY